MQKLRQKFNILNYHNDYDLILIQKVNYQVKPLKNFELIPLPPDLIIKKPI